MNVNVEQEHTKLMNIKIEKKLFSKSLELLLFIAVAELFYANQKSLVFFASDVKISNF